jgi:glycosyltransferase involved in cell wall biosynthesis
VSRRGPRILALTKYGVSAASTRQRFLQYEPALCDAGFTVDFAPLLGCDYVQRLVVGRRPSLLPVLGAYARRLKLLLGSGGYDVLWVQYEVFPYLPGFVERLTRLSKTPLVVDYDDAIFHTYDEARNPITRLLLGRKLTPLLRGADLCCCGNAYLEHYVRQYCRRTMVLPTVVDTNLYTLRSRAADGSPPFIGWIGSPSTAPYLRPLIPLLSRLASSGRARVRIVGAGANAPAADHIEFVDWSRDREVAEVRAMDIGIMPLPNDQWARGKCGYKLIQYMACGLPVVASPVGVNSDIVREGENGFLASDPDEWDGALRTLIDDPELRDKMGQAGRDRVVSDYSLASQAPRLVEAFREIIRR